jgi:RNA polymerase sigma-70 factor (ECF subfamily)
MSVFREEVAGLVPVLRAFARALAGGDHSLADDLVQDTMVNALRSQAQYQPGTNLEAWLFTILRNRFRSLRGRRHVTAEVVVEDLAPLATVAPPQDAMLEVMAFRRAFRRLPPLQREMLVLIGVRGLTYEEAAEFCGCEVGTAKSRAHRGRMALRAMLLDEPETKAAAARPAAPHGAVASRGTDRRPLAGTGSGNQPLPVGAGRSGDPERPTRPAQWRHQPVAADMVDTRRGGQTA